MDSSLLSIKAKPALDTEESTAGANEAELCDANAGNTDGVGEGSGPSLDGREIERLVREFHEQIFRYCYRLSGNAADAEDLVQQTFAIACQHLGQLKDASRVSGWLYRIARNSFLKSRRRQRPAAASSLEIEVDQFRDGSSETSANEQVINSDHLQLALDQLDAPHRTVLAMFYFEDLSYKEIAERLDIQMGTVMSRLSRARQRLKLALEKLG